LLRATDGEFTGFNNFSSMKAEKSEAAKSRLDDMMKNESEVWAKKRQLLAVSREHEQDGFLAGLSTDQALGDLMHSILPKPSTATTLLKLQEEFEDLRIQAESAQDNPGNNRPATLADAQPFDIDYGYDRYFAIHK